MRPGEKFVARPGFDRLDKAAAGNAALGAHLWVILVSYGLTDEEAAHAPEGVDVMLDLDHLLAVTTIGCYVCEQPYDKAAGKPCKGNPVSYTPKGAPVYVDGTTA